ncbi:MULTISPECIES: hypothetical protein [unclassified Nocardiopsis]|uniref:hypothetical protein n=1 Tax=Nocardiopsis TaxID=2013 RepID=UPI00387AF8CE
MPSVPSDPPADAPARIPGGPGWSMDPLSLLPVIDDPAEFRRAHAADPALPLLEELWGGRPERAEPLAHALVAASPTARHRALLADVHRDLGRTARAVAAYEELVEECRGTPREAVMLQHLGKAHFAARDHAAAARAFAAALRLRTAAGADPALIASSRAALHRARALLSDPSE